MFDQFSKISTNLPPLLTLIFILFFLPYSSTLLADDIHYQVQFTGVADPSLVSVLKNVSQLVTLENAPPATKMALRRRAEADVPNLIQGLQSQAYYNATIKLDIDESTNPVQIVLHINPGPIYVFSSVKAAQAPNTGAFPYEKISPHALGITLGDPAIAKQIIDAERLLIQRMTKKKHPLAVIKSREVYADQAAHTISVIFYVDCGPLARFGETIIDGCEQVDESFVRKKIAWEKGECYDPSLVERTQEALEAAGIFNSIVIMNGEALDDEGLLPMQITLMERCHRTIGAGASYTTQQGPGITAEWEHRNIRRRGERLNIIGNLWLQRQTGKIQYSQPDLFTKGQDLLWVGEIEHEITKGFSEAFVSLSSILDTQLSPRTKFATGITFKQLKSEESNNDGYFSLLKFPQHLRWSTANSLLDPTKGRSINYKFIPTLGSGKSTITYLTQTITGTVYWPMNKDHSIVLAHKLMVGSILGPSSIKIPPPERLYAGSENTIRGYNYYTVSPLDCERKPIGGRSLLIATFEPRFRFTEKFGGVLFYEIGNVYANMIPKINHKQLQSVGIGARYHTPVGPLRFDLAFPLNRRHGVDRFFQVYFSIGQAF